ncbi:MAG: GNAT family N-acetyltransferase [Pseudomonadota bacterium]
MGRRSAKQLFDRLALNCLWGARLQLRRPQLADAPQVYRYAAEPPASRFLAWTAHRNELETQQFLHDCIDAWHGMHGEERLPWVILADGVVVGMIEVKLKGCNAGMGYVLAPEAWGQGYATEALGLVSEALFHHTPVSAIWALCVTQNPASARVLEKCGYQREKLIPNYLPCPNLDGEKHDVWRYVRYRYPAPATQSVAKPV